MVLGIHHPAVPTLYDLETELVELFQAVTDAHAQGQEPPDEVLSKLTSYVDAAVAKRDRCAQFLLHLQATEEAINIEIERLSRKRGAMVAARDRMEGYILAVMDRIGRKKLEGQAFTFTAKQNPPSVVIDNTADVPEQYLRPQKPAPPREPDKMTIKKAIQAGEKVPGARLLSGKTRLEIG